MGKKIIADLLAVLLMINSLFAVPVNASVTDEQIQSSEEAELCAGEVETEGTESSVSTIKILKFDAGSTWKIMDLLILRIVIIR